LLWAFRAPSQVPLQVPLLAQALPWRLKRAQLQALALVVEVAAEVQQALPEEPLKRMAQVQLRRARQAAALPVQAVPVLLPQIPLPACRPGL